MTVSVLLITHTGIGDALVKTARIILGGRLPAEIAVVEVAADADLVELRRHAHQRIRELPGEGVLVMTDMYGSTPSNLAVSLATLPEVSVVTGVNLPMLVRALNYAHLALPQIVDKAVEGGLRSIFIAAPSTA